jgi:hypothetical protein
MMTIRRPPDFLSPVAPLIDAVPHVLARVAPEREHETAALLNDLTIEISDDPSFVCRASAEGWRIEVSTGVLEVLWCQAYAAYVFINGNLLGRSPAVQ